MFSSLVLIWIQKHWSKFKICLHRLLWGPALIHITITLNDEGKDTKLWCTSNLWLLTFLPFLFQTILGCGSPAAWHTKDATPPWTPVWSSGVLVNLGVAERREIKHQHFKALTVVNWNSYVAFQEHCWDKLACVFERCVTSYCMQILYSFVPDCLCVCESFFPVHLGVFHHVLLSVPVPPKKLNISVP